MALGKGSSNSRAAWSHLSHTYSRFPGGAPHRGLASPLRLQGCPKPTGGSMTAIARPSFLIGILVLVAAGCAPRLTPTQPALGTVETAQPANTPAPATPSLTPDPRCPEPTEGTQLLTHEGDGYCFLHPDGLLRVDSSEHAVCLGPEGDTQGCDNLVAAVEVTDAEGRTADQIADERVVAGEGGFEPGRCTAPIAGIQTVVLTETGGQGGEWEMLFVGGG